MEKNRISTSLTSLYKYTPIVFVFAYLISLILALIGVIGIDIFIDFTPLIIVLFVCVFPLFFIKSVLYNSSKIYIKGYIKTQYFELKDIVEINRFYIYFFRIKVCKKDDKIRRFLFIPSIWESFIDFTSTPKSINQLISKINLYNESEFEA